MGNDVLYVLLADDDANERLFFKDAIVEIMTDTLVSFVKDGSKLMYFLNQPCIRLPNIIFLDLNMPIKNGLECLKEIRANKRFTDLILIPNTRDSTSGSDHDIRETFAHDANMYIKKPNNFPDLIPSTRDGQGD